MAPCVECSPSVKLSVGVVSQTSKNAVLGHSYSLTTPLLFLVPFRQQGTSLECVQHNAAEERGGSCMSREVGPSLSNPNFGYDDGTNVERFYLFFQARISSRAHTSSRTRRFLLRWRQREPIPGHHSLPLSLSSRRIDDRQLQNELSHSIGRSSGFVLCG